MTHKLSDLLSYGGKADGDTFPVTALFHEPATHKLRYVALDIGGWLQRNEVLVEAERMGQVDPSAKTWNVRLAKDELEGAPHWDHVDPAMAFTAWPPLIVGPFGGTYSPLLMQAQLAAESHDAERENPEGLPEEALRDEQGRMHQLEQTEDWLGREARTQDDGYLGRVHDVEFDDPPRILLNLLVERESGAIVSVPAAKLRRVDEQNRAVFNGTVADYA